MAVTDPDARAIIVSRIVRKEQGSPYWLTIDALADTRHIHQRTDNELQDDELEFQTLLEPWRNIDESSVLCSGQGDGHLDDGGHAGLSDTRRIRAQLESGGSLLDDIYYQRDLPHNSGHVIGPDRTGPGGHCFLLLNSAPFRATASFTRLEQRSRNLFSRENSRPVMWSDTPLSVTPDLVSQFKGICSPTKLLPPLGVPSNYGFISRSALDTSTVRAKVKCGQRRRKRRKKHTLSKSV